MRVVTLGGLSGSIASAFMFTFPLHIKQFMTRHYMIYTRPDSFDLRGLPPP